MGNERAPRIERSPVGIICKQCNGLTTRIVPQSDVSAGEDYCKKCHKSYMHVDILKGEE